MLAEYYRRLHAERVRTYMRDKLQKKVPLVFNDVPLLDYIADLCESHAWGVRESNDPRNPTPMFYLMKDTAAIKLNHQKHLKVGFKGIEDMQNLATVSIVDVMLRTRVPVGRLVDWIDQAMLYLRVRDDDEKEVEGKPRRTLPGSSREILRRFGIRTATDLEDALGSSTNAGRLTPEPGLGVGGGPTPKPDTAEGDDRSAPEPDADEDVTWILNPHDDKGKPIGPSVTRTILSTLKREPNLAHVRAWKEWSPTP